MDRLWLPDFLKDDCHDISYGFFGRRGGVSTGLYDSLNCGFASGDIKENVQENRNRVAAHLGATLLKTVRQVHSPSCVVVESVSQDVSGYEADALVTSCPGVAIGVLAADCGPILFAGQAPHGWVIGAAHSGWGGALAGVLESTLSAMQGQGADISTIRVAVGPCIGPASYEVSAGFETPFLQEDVRAGEFFKPSEKIGKQFFDLPAYIAFRLQRAGITHIAMSGHDTYADTGRYFSYRRTTHNQEPVYGRQISAISIRGS